MAFDEKSYEQGSKMAWKTMLALCCRELGYDDPQVKKSSWIAERESIKNALRDICDEYGDNDWDDDLYLADVIEKHLRRNLDRQTNNG